MHVTESGIVKLVKDLQPLKANFSMRVTDFGMTKLVKTSHP